MTETQPKIGETAAYWTHKVDTFPGPVSVVRMAQLIDFDDRLYETARVVYRFMISWYHQEYGDALLSQRHVAKVMKQRAPEGAIVPSRNAVQRAILALMDTGWVVRSFQGRGRGKGASRYVPVINVLELATSGKFPELAHDSGPVEPAHANGPAVAHATGPVQVEPAHPNGPKTRLPDPAYRTGVQVVIDNSTPVAGGPLAAAPDAAFERLADAYAKPRDNLKKARTVFIDINPNADELARMIAAAESWRKSAGGTRMSLERWLGERRWLTARSAANDNRTTHRWPSCLVTAVKPKYDGDGLLTSFTFRYRDRDGLLQNRVLDDREFSDFQDQVKADRPRVTDPSEDMHEFLGARFQVDDHDGMFLPYGTAA